MADHVDVMDVLLEDQEAIVVTAVGGVDVVDELFDAHVKQITDRARVDSRLRVDEVRIPPEVFGDHELDPRLVDDFDHLRYLLGC